jgi:hypothetical protein
MKHASEETKPHAWNDSEEEASNLSWIARVLHLAVSEQHVGLPLNENDHESAVSPIGELFVSPSAKSLYPKKQDRCL